MKLKKLLCSILALALVLSTMGTIAFADNAAPVAKVGDTEYFTIDEAIVAWTNNTTLTLLDDVTLTSKISLLSTDCHTLDLGEYTMTAAKSQPAIEITSNMQTTAADCLIIKADNVNPGGITGSSNAIRCYTVDGDRPIIKIYGGKFDGSVSISKKFVFGDKTATPNDAYLYIYGGEFFKSVSANRAKTFISGGIFHQAISFSVDTTAYLLISGGKFYSPKNNYGSGLNENKWGFGTDLGKHDVDIYVDDDGYYVVTDEAPEKPGNFGASVFYDTDYYINNATSKGIEDKNGQFVFSKVGDEKALYYTSADVAVRENRMGTITLYKSANTDIKTSDDLTIDMSDPDADYTGNVTLGGKDHTFTVIFDSENPYEGKVTPYTGCALKITEPMGTIVSRTYSNVDACAKIGDTNYASLEEAVSKVEDGEVITLLKDIELNKSIAFTKDIEFTIDGNGKKITPAAASTEANSAFNFGQGNDSTRATRKYNLKNIVFDGWTTDHVVRLQGTTSVIENCEFINCAQPDGLGLVTSTFADVTLKGCSFENNNCVKAIDVNSWGDGSQSTVTIDDCTFNNNICTGNAVVLVSDGLGTTVKNSKFINNKVVSNINGATLYLGFNTGIKAIGNYFENNEVEISSTADYAARPYRSSGAIFAGFADDNCAIIGNAFINNTLKLDDADAAIKSVAYSAFYGAGDISGNYWGKSTTPVAGVDYTHEYVNTNPLALDDYYTTINADANRDFALSDLKYIVKDVKLDFVDVTDADAEGEKLYNINITAPGQIINRLNSVDLSFVHTKLSGDTEFEIIASNREVVINPVNNSKERYEFHYNGKTDVTTDTATTITIGQVRFEGYGKFSFTVDASVDTNAAHATKNDDNIVNTFVPGGKLADGTVVGDFDISDKDITGEEIIVPTRDLTIKVDFPNAVNKNIEAYQDMTVTVSGGDLARAIEVELGKDNKVVAVENEYEKDDAKYTVEVADGYVVTISDALTVNTAYTVTVSGAGYRTARYTVTMTEDKQLNFWNNVKDEAQVIEVGNDSVVTVKNFLAGDIVKDNKINIYDLSAVVSYFGSASTIENKYAKYDLNRDGVIDSKDVAYVLVSWDN